MAVTMSKSDLQHILEQIKIAEAHAAGAPLYGPGGLVPAYTLSAGLRTVDGTYNHLLPGQETWGSAGQQFPELLTPQYQTGYAPSNNPGSLVVDPSLRTTSNLIVDQTLGNPAAILVALQRAGSADAMGDLAAVSAIYETFKPTYANEYQTRIAAQNARAEANATGDPAAVEEAEAAEAAHAQAVVERDEARVVRDADLEPYGIAMEDDNVSLPNISPDEGLSASFNSWFTLFGQFFDHGLDLVNKGGSGTVFVPLQPDDPLYVAGSPTNFMVLTRATVSPGADNVMGTADDVRPVNTTTSFVDQNQTYTSHPSHQVFLRQYAEVAGKPVATGKLIEGELGVAGGMATWGEVKEQARMLGIELTDSDVGSVPLLRTDAYGNFIPNAAGYAQVVVGVGADGIPNTADDVVVSGTPGAPVNPTSAGAVRTNSAFLADIAHTAVPLGKVADGDIEVGLGNPGNGATEYDNELLDAHLIAGDGRVNENIGLTAVHHVFHSEHNRLAQQTKDVVLASGDLAFINEWLSTDIAALPTTPAQVAALSWDGERVFQAAKFTTEMEYQHLVFEEFARKVQPQINPFVVPDGFDTTIDPSIVAEFAHVVYRFGHSMLTESIDRYDPSFNPQHIGLIEGFLNPFAFDANHAVSDGVAAGAIIRGMTRQVGNEIDEFVTEALRNNLLGLPLDLPTINLARGRDTGVPSLNEARSTFYQATNNAAELKPYESWVDFAGNLKNEASIINFISAYGTHASITGEATLEGKRAAALTLITGVSVGGKPVQADAEDFLNGTGAYASNLGGLNGVDLWIGGLAEKILPFGGMLGSTFNFVFENQMESLQNGDRFYYLQRLDGTHLFGEMENNSFSELIMANTDARHLPSDVFSTPGLILEVDQSKQFNDLDGDGDLESTDPAGGGILTKLVSRNDPSTTGPDTNYLKYTGGEHVVLGGTEGDDVLIAGIGDDALFGDGGNDTLDGNAGNDIVNAGAGDDIVRDLGGDDNIKAGDGNDVVHGGPGLDLIMGGDGSDFIVLGTDAGSEVFAGQGDDFILGSKNAERILGNEGNDWIETGTFDGAPGDNFDEIFARDQVVGHDVFLGDGGFDEFIAEGGDDIMVGSAGRGVMAGMSGFDWATYKDNSMPVDADFTRGIVFDESPQPPMNGTLDSYESVEGLSGSQSADKLTGADTTAEERLPLAQGGAQGYGGSVLDAEGIERIDGLQEVLGAGVTSFSAGEIILGGGGSDVIMGRGGDDIIDGDKWLDVQIGAFGPGDTAHAGPAVLHDSMKTLVNDMFSGAINPGQLEIVRTIRDGELAGDVDTAKYQGVQADYAFSGNAAGQVIVTDVGANPLDGSDRLSNIERLEFADASLGLTVGTANPETLNGTSGNDLIVGLAGNDTLNGVAGDDVLVGGVGNDVLNGGLGNDSYMFALADGQDTVNEPVGATSGGTADRIVIQTGAGAIDGLNAADASTATNSGDLVISFNSQSINVNEHFTGTNPEAGVELINFTDGTAEGYALGGGDYLVSRLDPSNRDSGGVDLSASTANNFIAGENSVNDEITGGSGNDLIFGGTGDNQLIGGAGEDLLVGGSGTGDDDLLDGGLDADVLVGRGGNDTYVVDDAGDVVVETLAAGTDTVQTEMASYSLEAIANVENLTYTGADADPFTGTGNALNNVINGGDLGDGLSGLAGNDALAGGAGNDTLDGGLGNDAMSGGDGDDTFLVDSSTDTISEGAGAGTDVVHSSAASYTITDGDVENLSLLGTDNRNGTGNGSANVITGNAGNNVLNGAGGVDTVSYANATAAVTVSLASTSQQNTVAAGLDTLSNFENLEGSAFDDTLSASGTANVLTGAGGHDRLVATVDNTRDTLDGGAGVDSADYSAYSVGVSVNLGAVAPVTVGGSGTLANTDVLVSIENFTGGSGNDAITGNAGANVLNGGGGNDSFGYAIGGGTDSIDGGAGNDTLNISGQADNDVLDVIYNGGSVITSFEGGQILNVEHVTANLGGSADTLSFAGSTVDINVSLVTGTASGFDSVASIAHVTGGSGNDTIASNGGANSLSGGTGNDVLSGGAGRDTLVGGAGTDQLNGGEAGDLLIGGDGADSIDTGAANGTDQDVIRFTAVSEYGDVVLNFDADGSDAQDDQVEFTGALNAAYDDGNNNDNFLFVVGNGGAGAVNATFGQGDTHAEGALLLGAASEGVASASLNNAAAVSAAFNAEFNITAANGEDVLLVINDTNANNFSVWQWIQAGGGEVSEAELTLVGVFAANATVTAGNLDFA
jgi:Ca2+-binding RTX toxin-like protein